MAGQLDLFFFCGSTYTYLTVMRVEGEAARAGVEVRWRPFNVREIMVEQDNIPFRDKPVKMRYMWRDIERRAARHGIPFNSIPAYPVDPENLSNRVGTIAADEGWCPEYVKAAYRAWFLEDRPPGDPDHLSAILRDLGRDPDDVIPRADTPDVRERYAAETDTARSLGIFGSPTFVVDGEIFWGDDRLEEALEWCASDSH